MCVLESRKLARGLPIRSLPLVLRQAVQRPRIRVSRFFTLAVYCSFQLVLLVVQVKENRTQKPDLQELSTPSTTYTF